MNHYVNKLNEAKADNFLDSIRVKYTKEESTSPNVIKYTITSHEGHHKMLFIIEEVLERFHELRGVLSIIEHGIDNNQYSKLAWSENEPAVCEMFD